MPTENKHPGVFEVRAIKLVAVLALVYVGIVAAFESWLGYAQPTGQSTLVMTTTGADGMAHDRVLSRLESNGQLYVAANHWPRAWYHRALENPEVEAVLEGERRVYRVVPVADEEHDRVNGDNRLGLPFRILTGFPPRKFVRLDPR